MKTGKPTYFRSTAAMRKWLERHHAKAAELWVGFYRKDSGKGGITYPEAVDAALSYGWIDGIRKKVNAQSYTNRFTPRKRTSAWSAINRRRIKELQALGLMTPAGLQAFHGRDRRKQNRYSFENRKRGLPPQYQRTFKANPVAWAYFENQPAWYRRVTAWWIISAKQEPTRQRRLSRLIDWSERGKWIPQLERPVRTRRGRS